MTVDLLLAGKPVTPAGRQVWATASSVSEDATATNLADTFGGVGAISATTERLDNTMHLQGATMQLTFNPDGGVRTGIVESITDNDGMTQVSGSTNLRKLNRTIKARVVTTTLGDALKQYFQKCGIASSGYSIDSGIAARSVIYPGWSANCWEMLKQIATVEKFDIGEIAGVVSVFPRGLVTLSVDNRFSSSVSLTQNPGGRNVETFYYKYTKINNAPIYPPGSYDDTYGTTSPGGWSKDLEVLQVTPGTLTITEVPVMASLTSVQQPVCVKSIPPYYTGRSAYTVITNDGESPVDPAEWTRLGGKITVKVLDDSTTIRITVNAGKNNPAAAPFQICMTSGDGTNYASLHLNGSGVKIEKNRVRMPTSIPAWMTDTEVASSVDCVFVRSYDQAHSVLLGMAGAVSQSNASLSANVGVIPLPYGQRAGAIIRRPEANYRVRTCTTSETGSSLQADLYTTIDDFNAAWAGKTIDDFNAAWSGYRLMNVDSAPLLTEMPEAPDVPTLDGFGFRQYGSAPYGD